MKRMPCPRQLGWYGLRFVVILHRWGHGFGKNVEDHRLLVDMLHRFQKLSVLAYIMMGWLCVVAFKEMLKNIPMDGLIWLGVGGAAYTVGVIFYALRKIPYMHAIWHIFVLGGSICHYFAVLFYLAPSN